MPASTGRTVTLTLGGQPRALQWLLLVALTAVFIAALLALRLPAALLLSSMFVGSTLGTQRATVRAPAYAGAQAMVGGLIANAIAPVIAQTLLKHGPLFLASFIGALLASSVLGVVLSRTRVSPGTTAIGGATPGASTAMVLMAESWNADVRLVALMQPLRVTSWWRWRQRPWHIAGCT